MMTPTLALKYKIQAIECQINEDYFILKDTFIHMNVQISSINIIKYTGYIMLNAWLPYKGKQLLALASNIFKVMIR